MATKMSFGNTATAICADRIDSHLESLVDAGGKEYGL